VAAASGSLSVGQTDRCAGQPAGPMARRAERTTHAAPLIRHGDDTCPSASKGGGAMRARRNEGGLEFVDA